MTGTKKIPTMTWTFSCIRKMARKFYSIKLKYLLPVIVLLFLACDYMGVFVHPRELDYYKDFSYPLEGDIQSWIEAKKKGDKPKVDPVNQHDYRMLRTAKGKCTEDDGVHYTALRLVIIVKSAAANFDKRATIRDTWGYEKRFSDVPIRTVFLVGDVDSGEVMTKLEKEHQIFGDLVQGDFKDSYFNNTVKTMMGLRWAAEMCPTSRFYLFVDDDYYVSIRNLLRFLRNPVNYPRYLEEPVLSFDNDDADHQKRNAGRSLKQLIDFDLPEDVKMYAGYVFHSPPHRHKTSTWYVSLEEYPYHLWPPYVTAGAYVLSREAMIETYYASYFVKRFRFDDIYLGLVAKKIGMEPFHCPEFHFYKKPYSVGNYRYVIASHGFSDPNDLRIKWSQQKMAGNA